MIRARRRANQPIVGKLAKRDVDRIPLVLYIPPPPGDDTPASPISPLPRSVTHPVPSLRPPPPPPSKRRRFISFRPSLRRRDTKTDLEDPERAGPLSPTDDEADDWERSWERGSYPFVRLPENRATCMICLTEFEAPRRVSAGARYPVPEVGGGLEMQPLSPSSAEGGGPVEELRVESPREADARTIELADAGSSEAPQPLRLLSCGHAYHVSSALACPHCALLISIGRSAERVRGSMADTKVGEVPVLLGPRRDPPCAKEEE